MEFDRINSLCSEAIKNFEKASVVIDPGKPGSLYMDLVNQLKDLQVRFGEQKLNILVAGEVKVGKSTFINSLLGIDILPTSEEVCTNVPTKLIYGEKEKIIVHFSSDEGIAKESLEINREEVVYNSSEAANPENQKSVEYIELQLNSPLRAEGLAFIDTPGLGSIDTLHAILTFRVAKIADIIFFLSDVRKPLTMSEISGLKNLIKVSNVNQIVNLLTHCDLKEPAEIMAANKKCFDEDFADYNIQTIKVSSLLYQKYVRTGARNLLDVSGFQEVKTYLSDINLELKKLLNDRFLNFVYTICCKGHVHLKKVFETIEDPVAKEKTETELKKLLERIQEIKDQKTIWSQDLLSKQELLKTDLDDFILTQEQDIKKKVSNNLKDDYYLNNTEALTQTVTADLIDFQNSLNNKLIEGFSNIYEWLRDRTGLSKIQDQNIHKPNVEPVSIDIGEAGKSKIGEKIRNIVIASSIGFAVGKYGSIVGCVAGAKVGAMIGTMIAPGIGTTIGGILGQTAGLLVGIISGKMVYEDSEDRRKSSQRRELEQCYYSSIKNIIEAVKSQVRKANIPNSADLKIKFLDEVESEKRNIQYEYDIIRREATNLRQNYTNIKVMKETAELLCSALEDHEA